MEEASEAMMKGRGHHNAPAPVHQLLLPKNYSILSFQQNFSLVKSDKSTKLLRGPRRVVRLCVFALLLPAVLITVPLYVRLVLYPPAHLPMMPTDQRLLARHVSSVWCQAQTTHMNGTFTGYVTHGSPNLAPQRRTYVMLNHIALQDDVKEYWGFHLLRGSIITISACARWDGGQLMILKGVENLHRCAWIGEGDSAEDMEEDDDELSNERHRAEQRNRFKTEGKAGAAGEDSNSVEAFGSSIDPDLLHQHLQSEERRRSIKELLQQAIKISKGRKEILRLLPTESHGYSTKPQVTELLKDLQAETADQASVSIVPASAPEAPESTTEVQYEIISDMPMDEQNNQSTENAASMKDDTVSIPSAKTMKAQLSKDIRNRKTERRRKKQRRLDKNRKKEANTQTKNLEDEVTLEDTARRARVKRYVEEDGGTEDGAFEEQDADNMMKTLTQPEKQPSVGVEERAIGGNVIIPEGLKFERGTFNQSTNYDNSWEEHVSSYSSSEEALAKCDGVIFTLPLQPYRGCSANQLAVNKLSYTIPTTGTYYFVFSSDNEIYVNDLYFNLTMERVVYNVEQSEAVCANATDCSIPLSFWSKDQSVVEVPQENGWNNFYVLDTKCEPRVYVYLTLILLVPISIIFCAFR